MADNKDKQENNEFPDFLRDAPEEVKVAYAKYLKIRKEVDEHEHRFFTYEDSATGMDKTVDLKSLPYTWKRVHPNLPKEHEDRLLKIHAEEILPRQNELKRLKIVWNNTSKAVKLRVEQDIEKEIVNLSGKYYNIKEIREKVYEKFGFQISPNKVVKLRELNQNEINELRHSWSDGLSNIHLSQKRSRVEELCYIVETQKTKYKEGKKYRVDHAKEIRAALEQIRKEVEGDRIAVDVNGNIDITTTINMNLNIRQLMSKVSINNVVIALVAAKRGLDPMKFMTDLTGSYYKDFNGFNREIKIDEDPDYPSDLISTYDWNSIRQMHEEEVQDAEIVQDTNREDQVTKVVRTKLVDLVSKKINSGE